MEIPKEAIEALVYALAAFFTYRLKKYVNDSKGETPKTALDSERYSRLAARYYVRAQYWETRARECEDAKK